jgi:hypothetical protein
MAVEKVTFDGEVERVDMTPTEGIAYVRAALESAHAAAGPDLGSGQCPVTGQSRTIGWYRRHQGEAA